MATKGSSPRVRGKLSVPALARSARGLIPARAGKTWPVTVPAFGAQAHPRACGENAKTSVPQAAQQGSSPRVRGKRFQFEGDCSSCGLIPARTGKTSVSVESQT